MDIEQVMDDNILLHVTDELIPSFTLMFNNISQSKWFDNILLGVRTVLIVYVLLRIFYLITIKHRKTYQISILFKLISAIAITLYLFWDVYKKIKNTYFHETDSELSLKKNSRKDTRKSKK